MITCRRIRDPDLARELFPVLATIIHAHADGTRYGIRVDPRDGLLHAGEPGTQLTWMDAKHGDQVFTPRIGKPVEINALWLNALDVAARLAAQMGYAAEQGLFQSLLAGARAGFSRFWNAERACLYDVIDVDGGATHDARVRPNQILAVCAALLHLEPRANARRGRLLRPRTSDQPWAAQLEPEGTWVISALTLGGPEQRDAAYHMGTVWSWLLGPLRPGSLPRVRRCAARAVVPLAHGAAPEQRLRGVDQRDI